MFRNYLKIAWRNIRKHRTDSFINVAGLCVAFTSALLLLLSVSYEFSFDRFHKNAKDIYHLYFQSHLPKGEELSAAMPAPLMPALKAGYPDVRYAVRDMNTNTLIRYKDKKISQNLKFTDPDFLKMFSFPVIKGNANDPLSNLNQVVLRKGTAVAIFGKEEPVGKIIDLQWENSWNPFIVSAVIDEFPDNSSLGFDALIRFENLGFYKRVSTNWDSHFHDVYIQVNRGVSKKSFESKLPSFVTRYFSEDINRMKRDGVHPSSDGTYIKLMLQPLSDLHTNTEIRGSGDSINKNYLFLLCSIGLLILAIACINFINLSIGRSFSRSKEIGLRKTMGAQYVQVAIQFWGEALLICAIAFIMSCFACYLLLPPYRLLFAMNIRQDMLSSPLVWVAALLGFFLITLIAGAYPASLMAKLNVVEVLKGKMAIGRSNTLRNGLITFQFIITILLISCTLISWQQLYFLRSKPLGYNTSQIISVPVRGELDATEMLRLMRNKLGGVPRIESITGIYDNLGTGADNASRTSILGFDYKNREIRSNWMGVSFDFVKTLGLRIKEGRDFSPSFATDSSAVVINEEMAKEIGEKKIIGIRLPVDSAKPLTVIGVVKNFNFKSLRQKIDPLTLVLDQNFSINYILIKVKPDHLASSMKLIQSSWASIAPRAEFLGSFLDENVNRQYKREEKLMQIFILGAVIAMTLSYMGLFAMVILILSQRTKEIGIRKVLGAKVKTIVLLVGKDFLLVVCLATLIAMPVGWWLMNQWLQGFAYHIQVGWYMFAIAGTLALLIALLTVSVQTIRTAVTNPVKSLRTE